MSNPQALFFDTSILVAFFNKNSSEQKIGEQAVEYSKKFPHAARMIVTPCLVELFYKTRKFMDPKDVRLNLDLLSIKLFPVTEDVELDLFDKYCKSAYKNEFDYADFFLCSVALLFNPVQVLTMDKDDLALAMSRAYAASAHKSQFHLQTFL